METPDEIVENEIEQMKFEKGLIDDINESFVGAEYFEDFWRKIQELRPDMTLEEAQAYWAEEMEIRGTKYR